MKKLMHMGERSKIGQQEMICLISEILILGVIIFSSRDVQGNKGEIIVIVIIILVLMFLLGLYAFFKWELHKFAFIFILLTGGLLVFVQPILNTPDETVHFDRAEMVSNGVIVIDSDILEYDTIQSTVDLRNELHKTYTQSGLTEKEINYTSAKTLHVAAANPAFLYFPQALGIRIAKILHLKVIWLLWLGRLMNLLSYSLLISLGIKIAPKWKFPLFFVATLPISIQQAASCSPDAMINSLSLLLISYFLYLYSEENIKITQREIIIFSLIGVFVTLAKVTNIFLVGLILIIPKERFSNEKKVFLIKGMVIVGIVILGGVYYLYTMSFPMNLEHKAYLESIEAEVVAGKQLQYILNNTLKWMHDFLASLIEQADNYVITLNSFGWLDYGYSILNIIVVFELGKVCIQEQGVAISQVGKFLIFLMVGGIYCATCLALYISWTSVGASYVSGVQGRYFIPMIALFTLMFSNLSDYTRKKEKYMTDMTVITSMLGVLLVITTLRYY